MIEIFEFETQERVAFFKRGIQRFSRAFGKAREKWVVFVFLRSLDVAFDKSEMRNDEQASAVDIYFRDAAFQVKESLDLKRRRTQEYKDDLNKARAVRSNRELIDHILESGYDPKYLPIGKLVESLLPVLQEWSEAYSSESRANTDLLVYVNHIDIWGVDGNKTPAIHPFGWRSISITKGGWSAVLSASPTAPAYLRTSCGVVKRTNIPLPELEEFV